jgi:hypothetical protein
MEISSHIEPKKATFPELDIFQIALLMIFSGFMLNLGGLHLYLSLIGCLLAAADCIRRFDFQKPALRRIIISTTLIFIPGLLSIVDVGAAGSYIGTSVKYLIIICCPFIIAAAYKPHFKKFEEALINVSALVGFLGIFQIIAILSVGWNPFSVLGDTGIRVGSVVGHFNALAIAMTPGIFLAGQHRRWVAFAMILGGALVTGSRSLLAGLFMGLVVAPALTGKVRQYWISIPLIVLGGIIIIGGLYLLDPQLFLIRFGFFSGHTDVSTMIRLYLAQQVLTYTWTHNLLLGSGLGQFQVITGWDTAESGALLVLFETGILGVLAYFGVVGYAIFEARRTFWLCATLLSLIPSILLQPFWLMSEAGPIMWLMIGYGIVAPSPYSRKLA